MLGLSPVPWHCVAMQGTSSQETCPDFAAVVRAALPVSSSSQGPGVRAQFLDDVERTYKRPLVRIDILDLDVLFREVREPALGIGIASGEGRAMAAAQQAFHEISKRRGAPNALIVLAFAPGEMRLGESQLAWVVIRELLGEDGFVLRGLIEDEQLARGTLRVSVLVG